MNYPTLALSRADRKLLTASQTAKRDPQTGLVWIEDGSAGVAHSAHPNVQANKQTRRMYPERVECRGFLYSADVFASTELDKVAARYCGCKGCRE